MKKQIGKNLMQKWKNKAGVKLSALDKKKLVLTNLPYVLTAFYANRASCLYRSSPGEDIGNKLLYAMEHADRIFAGLLLSFDLRDLLVGVTVAVILKLLVWQKQSDAKKLRKGIEYGSARWGTAEDIKPYMSDNPWMNIPLTATEALTMESRPKQPKYARNKNIVVIGGSGSGKTRFFVKPSIMQMNCSMVITDPKGGLVEECGKLLAKGPPMRDKDGNVIKNKAGKVIHEPYVIKVLNTINFSKSLHYNPFAYIRSEKDILKLVTTIIVNTKGEGEKASEDFWVKAEKLLYTALIAFIWYEGDEEEKNLNTLLDLLNESETREEDETYQNPVDMMFQELEERDPQHFAVRQYKKYKMAAGKTAKSILISCGARLAPFDIAELREIMSYDEMELDKMEILNLNSPDYHILNWLALLADNRTYWQRGSISEEAKWYIHDNFLPDISGYDVIIGYRADDSYFVFAQDFVAGTISLQKLSEAMRLGKLGEQIVLKSRRAFEEIRYLGSEFVSAEEYYGKKLEREREARREYRKKREKATQINELFILDIMREGMKNEDLRLRCGLS